MQSRRRKNRVIPGSERPGRGRLALLWLERGLVGLGLICIGLYVVSCVQRSVVQQRESHAFDEDLARALQTERPDQSEWSKRRIELFEDTHTKAQPTTFVVGRLMIPDADVEVMVLEGTDENTLDRGVGLIEGTARPGERGNVGIAGHRDSFFRGLRHLSLNDEIELATLEGLARYRVNDIVVVEPNFVQVLDPTPEASLTLVTCYPFYYVGAAPQRFIVHAKRVGFEEWTPVRVARFVSSPPHAP